MNIVMSQIDMFLIETGSDLVMTTVVATYYLREKEKDAKLTHKENRITDKSFTDKSFTDKSFTDTFCE
jgi:hypothetical protein